MLIGTHILLGAALMTAEAGLAPSVHLAGRPTTFDYYKKPASTTGWIEAVIRKVDKRSGTITVRNSSSDGWQALTFPVDDHADISRHRAGDVIKIQVFQGVGGLRARHRDRNP
jgi:Cu/Ag efflux protein CusF